MTDKKKKTPAAVGDAGKKQEAGKKPAAARKRAPRSRNSNPIAVSAEQAPAAASPTDASSNTAAAQPSAVAVPASPAALIRVPLSVRWRDLDAFNHVNNSKFLSYLEEARLRWMVTLPGHGMDEHVAPVVAAAHLNYRRPIEWPNEIDVELFVERLGTTSLSIGHRIVGADDASAVYCDGNVVLVWIHRDTGQPAALPEPVRSACSAAK
ncbi:acyl-CoA thioesterase [Pseudomonas sp. CGJS7]|uniref:acyl-CoA thioesterase n=1 Tax=Pseudomonas sp. CGJS7 TaxID=3109348 RepID=UPI00300A027C